MPIAEELNIRYPGRSLGYGRDGGCVTAIVPLWRILELDMDIIGTMELGYYSSFKCKDDELYLRAIWLRSPMPSGNSRIPHENNWNNKLKSYVPHTKKK